MARRELSYGDSCRVRLVPVPPHASGGRKHFPLPVGAPLADSRRLPGRPIPRPLLGCWPLPIDRQSGTSIFACASIVGQERAPDPAPDLLIRRRDLCAHRRHHHRRSPHGLLHRRLHRFRPLRPLHSPRLDDSCGAPVFRHRLHQRLARTLCPHWYMCCFAAKRLTAPVGSERERRTATVRER